MNADIPHFKIRLPRDLKAKLEEAAKSHGRSLTAEIVRRLEASFSFEIPSGLMVLLQAEARAAGRSLNAEIIQRLMGAGAPLPAQVKQKAVLDALVDAAGEVVRWHDALSDHPDATEYKEAFDSAMDDLAAWHTRLGRLNRGK
ncbi:Arc family DNA-binding protein [Pseudoxanthomonas suwonensis]|uniref:Arc family DNA-binding protein n=1 Tax=Pseudoxanthomonas suwonensis TaxID=314722 RepID=UPI00138F9B22|nr:Arc family DNA-binding protein [Pseudoxanthomonas suwonensis]KAF1704042.1 hypothetical protein CSC68_03525 [Pseudoxanthomonas suwonensis]